GCEHAGLPLKTKNGAVNIGLAGEHAGVVDQVARGKIVGAVGDDVELAKQLQRIGAGQFHVERPQVQEGIERRQFVGGGVELLAANVVGGVDDLALQVGVIHDVEVHDARRSDARGRHVEFERRAKSALSNAQHLRGLQLPL